MSKKRYDGKYEILTASFLMCFGIGIAVVASTTSPPPVSVMKCEGSMMIPGLQVDSCVVYGHDGQRIAEFSVEGGDHLLPHCFYRVGYVQCTDRQGMPVMPSSITAGTCPFTGATPTCAENEVDPEAEVHYIP